MNKKYVLRNVDSGATFSCVIDENRKIEDQLEEYVGVRKGGGLAIRMREDGVELMDYFHNSSAAMFKILSVEDTDLAAPMKWIEEKL